MSTPPPVPVPLDREGTRNRFPEPKGTGGTALFEPLGAFMDRTKDLPDPRWLLEGLIPELGQVWVLAAPGSGKTWFSFVVARHAAQAGRDVFIIEEEGGAKGLHNRFLSLGFTPAHIERVRLCHARGVKLLREEHLKSIEEALRAAKDPVLILDPLTAIFSGDENATDDASLFRDQLGLLMRANSRLLLIILHHTSKGAERAAISTYAGRGSSVFTGAADLELLLKRNRLPKGSEAISFNVEAAKPPRDLEPPEPVRLTIRLGTGELEMESIDDAKDATLRDRIKSTLRTALEPMSKSGIAKVTTGNRTRLFESIDEMVADGELRKVGAGFELSGDPS